MMERAGKPAGHDFGDNRVPGAGQRVRECLTERPELDNQVSLIRDAGGQGMAAFGGAAWPPSGIRRAALRGLPAISVSGGPRIAPRRAPNREDRSAAMKWVRVNAIWYYEPAPEPRNTSSDSATMARSRSRVMNTSRARGSSPGQSSIRIGSPKTCCTACTT